MGFGKEFKKQMVPEWTEAYLDYHGLRSILQDILHHKLSKQPGTHFKSLEKKLSLHRALSGLHLHPSKSMNEGDVEEQVVEVNRLQKNDSGSGEGVDIEADELLRKLDEELNKVNTFYKEKVEAVMDEASLLNKQMEALFALRSKVHCSDISTQGEGMGLMDSRGEVEMRGISAPEESSNSGSENMGVILQETNQDGESNNGCQEVGNSSATQQDPHEILEGVKINNTLESPLSTIKGFFKDSKNHELSFDKVELRKVENRLRKAFIEFYQKLQLLKHYSFLNLSALSKIMKTYEKITSRRAAKSYMRMVDNSYIGSCDEVNNLLERVEATFIKHFSNSNIQKGMKALRPKSKKEKHSVTFWCGFFSGFSIALLIAVILRVETRRLTDKEGASYMVNVFPLYSVFGYIVLHMLIYAADIYFWRHCRINYPFIFGFKQGTELSYREFFLLGTGLAVLTLASFLGNLHLDLGSKTQNHKTLTQLFPLGLVAIVLLIMICPFDIIYRPTRFFFIKSLFRSLCAPLYKVTLADFFLADNITSQVQAIRGLDLYICYYGLGEMSRRQSRCQGHGVYNVLYFAIALIPFWIRLLQTLRRLVEEKDSIHLYGCLNYLVTIIALLIRTVFELKKGKNWMVLALVSSAVTTVISTYGDVYMDWGLLRRHSKNPYLRDKLLVPYKSVYFAAMAVNIVLRIAWVQMVLEFNLPALHRVAITTAISCLEIIRRGIWNFFRLENEHLNNVGKFRAFKSVPLPFNYDDDDDDDEGDNDEDDVSNKNK